MMDFLSKTENANFWYFEKACIEADIYHNLTGGWGR